MNQCASDCDVEREREGGGKQLAHGKTELLGKQPANGDAGPPIRFTLFSTNFFKVKKQLFSNIDFTPSLFKHNIIKVITFYFFIFLRKATT